METSRSKKVNLIGIRSSKQPNCFLRKWKYKFQNIFVKASLVGLPFSVYMFIIVIQTSCLSVCNCDLDISP